MWWGSFFQILWPSHNYLNLTNSNFRHGLWFFEKQRFLSRLPCGVYLSTVRNSTFVDRISSQPLKAMAKNHHFWRCLPIEYIRDMMKKTRIGRKLSILTAIEACHAIRRVHNPDLEVCISTSMYVFSYLFRPEFLCIYLCGAGRVIY